MILLTLLACGRRCDPQEPALDYSLASSWVCKPGQDDLCSGELQTLSVSAQGETEAVEIPESQDQDVDCFYIYPTMDLRLRLGLDQDVSQDLEGPNKAALAQFSHFRQACNTWAPIYRQATIGTYYKSEERAEPCFDTAYSDTLLAWEQYLQESDRPFVLIGHSQGAQHLYRLLEQEISQDPELSARMIAAYPIGAPVADSSPFPLCSDATTPGCLLAWRSYTQGNPLPAFGAAEDGGELSCTHPYAPDSGEWTPLDSVLLLADEELNLPQGVSAQEDLFLRYEDAFSARCVEEDGLAGLEVRWDGEPGALPFALDEKQLSGKIGAHILDMSWGQYALIEDLQARSQQ